MEFHKQGESTEKEILESYESCLHFLEELEFKNMLSEKSDSMSAVLQITAGAGGTESCDWAQMLMRMYIMYCQKHNFKLTSHVMTLFGKCSDSKCVNRKKS